MDILVPAAAGVGAGGIKSVQRGVQLTQTGGYPYFSVPINEVDPAKCRCRFWTGINPTDNQTTEVWVNHIITSTELRLKTGARVGFYAMNGGAPQMFNPEVTRYTFWELIEHV